MSNETQKVSPAKTKSAHNKRLFGVFLLAATIFGAAIYCLAALPSASDSGGPSVTVKNTVFRVMVADSDAERIQGLSGTDSLPSQTGMLFVFAEPAQQCIWMKDMNYSIDILWIDSTGQVTDIAQRVSPDTYPDDFCSSDATKFVLELPAGSASEHKIQVGDPVKIWL